MNWKLLCTTYAAVFLAELGDKTQLATLSFAAANRSFTSVFLGSALALMSASFLATLAGSVISRLVPLRWVSLGAGTVFVLIGIMLILKSLLNRALPLDL